MRMFEGRLSASPTDLANFLACRHKTSLDLLVAEGQLEAPTWTDPLAEVLRKRGLEHEARHVGQLRAEGLVVLDLADLPADERRERTIAAMREGVDVIVQPVLADDRWFGYADVLRRVDVPSAGLGAWSYEAQDTKLARETRGGTVLQLCVYTDLIGHIQDRVPESFHVVTPAATETYRFADFGALYRQTALRFRAFVQASRGELLPATYPEPVEHCLVCRWARQCTARRRADDHLSFVAGMGRVQQAELVGRDVTTLAKLAALPVPLEFLPKRGSKEPFERLCHQARLQAVQRTSGKPTFDALPVHREFGLTQLPEPRPGDLFLDLEGDPFGRPGTGAAPGENGREYLFGLGRVGQDGSFRYQVWWALNDAEERAAFESVMDEIMVALAEDPAIHVYHYAPYEPTAFKRLMGRYASREADVDRLLRGRRFVDLYAIVRHAVRAGVERYSIKDLEPFYEFVRDIDLEVAGDQRHVVELALEIGDTAVINADVRSAVEGYNKDDCRSTLELQRWLERLRQAAIDLGQDIARPPLEPDAPSEKVSERQQRVNELRVRLLEGIPTDRALRTPEQQAIYLVAYLLDWHTREDKANWWEYYRLIGLADEDLFDEPGAVSSLELAERLGPFIGKKTGKPTGSVIDRYRYPPQECEIRAGATLKLRDESKFGDLLEHDRHARLIDVKKGKAMAEIHPVSAFAHDHVSTDELADSLLRLGATIAEGGVEAANGAAIDLLLRRPPAVLGNTPPPASNESAVEYAARIIDDLGASTLPIQGPPGAGKTFTGAKMIAALVANGRRVGVTATSHKVIRNLLKAAAKENPAIRLGQRVGEDEPVEDGITNLTSNDVAFHAIQSHGVQVLGGTAWLWSRHEFAHAVDVLFVDEAGQMSLANALAVSQAATGLVLLGDPQQLEQPKKGSHPDGVDASALDHVLGGHKTMPEERGLFLPVTWRLAPAICAFTSEVFYESKLTSKPGLEHQRLTRAGRFDGAGLFVVNADHDDCRNASDREVEIVAAIIEDMLDGDAHWVNEHRAERPLTASDILVVAPYNAHVSRLQERLDVAGIAVGTVDKFQGQQAPVVIYSMATSRPQDAPRGMEFLYSLNRLNVATSRAQCACIVVASPRLFEPECRTPRQMQLANGLARLREMQETEHP